MAQREQLNLRLLAETFEILEAAAYLESVTVPEYVKGLVERHAGGLLDDHAIVELRRVKAERTAVRSGRVTRLHERRGGKET